MALRRALLLTGLMLAGGCLWPVREKTERTLQDLVARPYDLAGEAVKEMPRAAEEPAAPAKKAGEPGVSAPGAKAPPAATDIQTTAYMQAVQEKPGRQKKFDLVIPTEVPGSEAPLIQLVEIGPDGKPVIGPDGKPVPLTGEKRLREINKLYPPLPALPTPPTPVAGPNGQPYTLADLQRLATEYSPTLRQAVSDVEAARGALLQAKAWPNPTFSYQATPSNNGSTAGAQGIQVEQLIKTFGKLKLASAAAQKDLDNAELALRRARSDLSTAVRNAYFSLLVAQETMRVTGALARFTDEIYRVFTDYLRAGTAASYEPASLRAQAYTIRLAYQQAIAGYVFAWQQLVATLGLPHLALSEVSGRVDRLIPYYDFDAVKAQVLQRHTDVLTARNVLQKARYNLQAAQIAPYPDVDVTAMVFKEFAINPFAVSHTVAVAVPLPIWDRNKGNIISAQAALIRAEEESHRVEVTLTNSLAAAYLTYKTNLDAVEYYRRNILPDFVRAYRGIFDRRQIDIADLSGTFANFVTAQQALTSGVTTYLGILGSLWSGAVSVADFLQTDDLFQLAQPRELPELPDLEQLPRWLCPHGRLPLVVPAGACPAKTEGCIVAPTAAEAPAGQPMASPRPAPSRMLTPKFASESAANRPEAPEAPAVLPASATTTSPPPGSAPQSPK
jgi:cobalt-zinc-cadmium efflux system outer membrane protein